MEKLSSCAIIKAELSLPCYNTTKMGVYAMRLLYAEDEAAMAEAVADILTYHNFTVDTVSDGQEALAFARLGQYDGIILDIMLPGLSGLEVLQQLRSAGSHVPVLLLTAKSEVEDRILGLNMGADDYLPKPFSMGELVARVRAMLRRREQYAPDLLQLGNLCLDRQSWTLSCGGKAIPLPKLEYQMMELLMLNRGIYLSSEELLVKLWGYDTEVDVGAVWVYVSHLRKHMAQLEANVSIRAKRSIGYTLEVKP